MSFPAYPGILMLDEVVSKHLAFVVHQSVPRQKKQPALLNCPSDDVSQAVPERKAVALIHITGNWMDKAAACVVPAEEISPEGREYLLDHRQFNSVDWAVLIRETGLKRLLYEVCLKVVRKTKNPAKLSTRVWDMVSVTGQLHARVVQSYFYNEEVLQPGEVVEFVAFLHVDMSDKPKKRRNHRTPAQKEWKLLTAFYSFKMSIKIDCEKRDLSPYWRAIVGHHVGEATADGDYAMVIFSRNRNGDIPLDKDMQYWNHEATILNLQSIPSDADTKREAIEAAADRQWRYLNFAAPGTASIEIGEAERTISVPNGTGVLIRRYARVSRVQAGEEAAIDPFRVRWWVSVDAPQAVAREEASAADAPWDMAVKLRVWPRFSRCWPTVRWLDPEWADQLSLVPPDADAIAPVPLASEKAIAKEGETDK